ncbi:mono/diheme cytochrome c family protein [Spirosoma oryzae]|uniref:Mono/diheme cytochrome c family protein n=1 Tax=Spirosoma oryzae TaxID=1469603 RepID=A0A2T0TIP3_9BACT|nr:cytochrome c [Spirosoma oryzae]PRY45495.1 mono/diheme cytochrome c family protein [Spirosoma oryzae]
MKSIATLIASLFVTVSLAQTKPVTTPPASKATTTAVKSPGQTIYEQHCLTCHQANGSGVPNLNPPLRNVDWVTGDKTRLINVLLKGLQGQEIDGETYDNVMPAHDFLTDQQLADVLTYIRSSFGNKASEIKPEEVKALRGKK